MIVYTFQLSLRENPLVVRFVQEISLHPPSLLELSARVIRTSSISFEPHEMPRTLREYLNTAHHCVNPKCKGKLINSRFMYVPACVSVFGLTFESKSSDTHVRTQYIYVIGDNEKKKQNYMGLSDSCRFRCIL